MPKSVEKNGCLTIEREVRRRAAVLFREKGLIPSMIDRIKVLFEKE